jgi:hypothetical protein
MTRGRRGPKRKQGKREPNGKLSRRLEDQAVRALGINSQRDLAQRETLALGVAARARVHDVKLETAVDQMAGSFVGRLRMDSKLTAPQYHAAEMFAAEQANCYRAIGGPRPPGAIDLNATRGGANAPENVEWVQEARQRYAASVEAVQAKQNELHLHGHLIGALQYLVVQDIALTHLVADLLIALDTLAVHYGLVKPEKPKKALAAQSEAA